MCIVNMIFTRFKTSGTTSDCLRFNVGRSNCVYDQFNDVVQIFFSQRDNRDNATSGASHVSLSFLKYPNTMRDVFLLPCGLNDNPSEIDDGKTKACSSFGVRSFIWSP